MKRKILLLTLWLSATLFPFGYLTLFSRRYANVFNVVFDAEAAHVVMHTFIFCGLMILLVITFNARASLTARRLLLFYLVVAAMAVSQELIQLWYKQHAWGDAETFDVATDFIGAMLGLIGLISLNGLIGRNSHPTTSTNSTR